MPYGYPQFKYYTIDYKQLEQYFIRQVNNNLFHSKRLNTTYINEFLNLLRKHDIEYTKINKNKYLQKEIFKQPMNFDEQMLYIQFNVTNIISDISANKHKYITRNINLLKNDLNNYFWTPPRENIYSNNSSIPIIAIPFYRENSNWLIVDGNHRLKSYIKNNVTEIPIAHILPQYMLSSSFYCSEFDKILYSFLFDITTLANAKYYDNLSDKKLLDNSLIQYFTDTFS
ncbi:hypothetical protein [Enterococcus cecorum]|uniref:ParB/Sulfiredoxin domain-containing protein n=1 Tax=Enterococcus cecorum TaxID=44008 RepID=A0A7X9RMQ9_9ENTE|nr:hypothetical protein [Enterococcus cecorum]NME50926.1 hypothetical protein [Enterococcus cecorum]